MTIDELLNSLRLSNRGQKESDGCVIIDLEDSDEFSRVYSRLNSSDMLEADDDLSNVNSQSSNIIYYNDDFLISLVGDLEQDKYKITIKPTKRL